MDIKKSSLHFLPAGEGDCIVFQFQDDDFQYRNILIDGGNRNKAEFKKQKKRLLEIIDHGNKGRFDLVIVTHSDDDHIKGIINLVSDNDLEKFIDKYWFNSEKSICNELGYTYHATQKYLLSSKTLGAVRSSRNQDHNLHHELIKSGKWDQKVIDTDTIEIIGNAKLTVLSPTTEKLKLLSEHWPSLSLNKKNMDRSSSCVFDHNKTIEELKTKLDHYKEDGSKVNGASIAILLEWEGYQWLLLSDSQPSVVKQQLDKISSITKFEIEAVKISHHGSRNNTSNELLEKINCCNFVITSNANAKHCHPNKDALVRVLDHFGEANTNFHFNYKNNKTKNIFSVDSFSNEFFPVLDEEGIVLNYES